MARELCKFFLSFAAPPSKIKLISSLNYIFFRLCLPARREKRANIKKVLCKDSNNGTLALTLSCKLAITRCNRQV